MRRVLVTGGAGFIGCELSRALVDRGDEVVCVDALHPQVHPNRARPARLPDEARLVVADVTLAETWDDLLPGGRFDVVVHLAAETGTGQSFTEATRHGLVNVVGTTRLVDALLRHDAVPDHVVLASSRAVYGEGAWESPAGVVRPGPRRAADLDAGRWDPPGATRPLPSRAAATPPAPSNVYAATKLAQEHVLGAWCAATGAALSVLRLQNVYGPGQSLTNSYTGVVALFARLAAEGRAIDVYEDGRIVRDLVHVGDVVSALVAAVEAPGTRTLDVGSGAPTTIHDVARLVAALRGAPEPVVSGRWRAGDVRAACCDVSDARAELGWAPRWSLEDGLRDLLAWIDTQR